MRSRRFDMTTAQHRHLRRDLRQRYLRSAARDHAIVVPPGLCIALVSSAAGSDLGLVMQRPGLTGYSLYHGKRQGARHCGLKSKNMTAPKGQTEANRALALGATIRKLRRERRLTLTTLAERVPMSASNLSRIELGSQGPPPDETIERIAVALQANPKALLRAAGRYASGRSFEEAVLARLDVLGRDLRTVKGDVGQIKAAIAGQDSG